MACRPVSKPPMSRNALWVLFAGTLASLGACWFVFRPPAWDRDRVWRIGTDNALPFHGLREIPGRAPEPIGIAGGLIAAAAKRRGVKLEWTVLRVSALSAGKVDLWPLNTIGSTSNNVRITRPFVRDSLVVVSREEPWGHGSLKEETRRIVVRKRMLTELGPQLFPKAQLLAIDGRVESLIALCSGRAEFLLIEARPLQANLLQPPAECLQANLHILGLDLPPRELGIGSSLEAAAVASVLREEIDSIMADGSYKSVLKDWTYFSSGEVDLIFRENSAKRATSVSLALASVLLILLAALCRFVVLMRRSQQAALAADEAKTQFLANMSHEIRTPLNGILGISEILLKSPLDVEQSKLVAMLRSSGKNLLCIVNDVLDLARVASGQIQVQPEVMMLKEMIQDALGPLTVEAQKKGLEFHVTGLDPMPDSVVCDPVRLKQILVNLAGNAIKFTHEGSVRVCFLHEEGAIRISVSDTGIGISDSGKQHLFEKFFQADSSISRRFGGTGLGLAIVKELIASMNGSIEVESVINVGSTFRVSIPVQIVDKSRNLEVEPELEPKPDCKFRVLVVEDNLVNQIVVRSLLETMGYQVSIASDGEEGVASWSSGAFDVILMDLHMPKMDGVQATIEIRKQEAVGKRIPIIALTASAMANEKERCIAAGMDDFLAKPIQGAELNRVLQHWLSGECVANP